MGIKAILSTLPYVIKSNVEKELWQNYVAKCARIVTENTAKMVQGRYIEADYGDIINPKPQKKYIKGEIANKIKAKLR